MDAVARIRGWKRPEIFGAPLSAELVVHWATLGIVAVGLWLRSRGYLFSTEALWQDEANWAVRLIEDPLLDHLIRPIGFMAVTKALVKVLSPSETVLRALPWAAGIAVTLLSPQLAKRLFASAAARLLFVSIVALDPAAIDLSKEFKPYSVSLGLHAALLLTVLRYRDGRKGSDLAWVLSLAVPGVLFAQDAVFAYPSIFLILGIDAVLAKKWRHLLSILGGAAVTVGIIGSLYVYVWSKLDQSKEESFWGKKYDVFYVAPKRGEGDQVGWLSSHYAKNAEMPGIRNGRWTSPRISEKNIDRLRSLDDLAWLVLHIAGLTVLVRGRRFREALLLFGPLAVMLGFNVLGRWPLGAFRTNVFTLVYAAAIAAFAFDRTPKKTRWADLLPALVLVFLPLFVFERSWHAEKGTSHMTTTSRFPDALRTLIALQGASYKGPREPLVVDLAPCRDWEYYTKYHPTVSKLTPVLNERFEYACGSFLSDLLRQTRAQLKSHDRVWLISGHPRTVRELDDKWPDDLRKTKISRMGHNTQLVIAVTKAPVVEAPKEPEGAGVGLRVTASVRRGHGSSR